MITIEQTRKAWVRAANFPANKEQMYPEHAVVQEFDLLGQKNVLEYGCGGGSDTLSYLRRLCRVWYVDVVPENVQRTTERVHMAGYKDRAYPLVLDDSAPIPLGAGYFEVVNAHGVVHHIEDPHTVEFVINEFRRLLKADGVVYVMLYTEMLWRRCAARIDALVTSGRCATPEEAFAWTTDGEGAPYARAYTEEEGRALFSPGFNVLGARVYNNGDFRTFKAVRA